MGGTKLLHTEKEHHKQAFETYYGLGLKRTYKAVADKYEVSVSTIKNWSRSFGWRDRIVERDAAITRQVANRTLQEGIDENERNLKIVEAALIRTAKEIAAGRVKVTMKDVPLLIQLDERLRGVSDKNGKPVGQVILYMPDNGRDKKTCPTAPGEFAVPPGPDNRARNLDGSDG